jgi:hypothetical protein
VNGFAGCVQDAFVSWRVGPTGVRGYQGPHQAMEFWILDVDGRRLLIETTRFPESSASDVAELEQLVDSIRIEPRPGVGRRGLPISRCTFGEHRAEPGRRCPATPRSAARRPRPKSIDR